MENFHIINSYLAYISVGGSIWNLFIGVQHHQKLANFLGLVLH